MIFSKLLSFSLPPFAHCKVEIKIVLTWKNYFENWVHKLEFFILMQLTQQNPFVSLPLKHFHTRVWKVSHPKVIKQRCLFPSSRWKERESIVCTGFIPQWGFPALFWKGHSRNSPMSVIQKCALWSILAARRLESCVFSARSSFSLPENRVEGIWLLSRHQKCRHRVVWFISLPDKIYYLHLADREIGVQ